MTTNHASTCDAGTGDDGDGDGGRLAQDLALVVSRLARQLRGHYRHSSPLTLTQLSTLNVLASDGPLQFGQLAARERMTAASMTRIVRSLAELGLISRESNLLDARVVILTVTDAGHQAVDTDRQARQHWLTDKLAALTDHERDTLTAAIELLERMQADPDAAGQRS